MDGASLSGFETIAVETRDKAAIITVNRPAVLNALSVKVLQEISDALDRLDEAPSLAAIVFTGQGPKAFVGGADIGAMEKLTPDTAMDFSRFGQDLFLRIERYPALTIAAVNGFALGGGNELAMSCDIRIAAKNAKFGQPEVGLGITPGFGGTQRLARLVGRSRAVDLILSGRIVGADEAYRIGLADRLVEEGEALTQALSLVAEVGKKSPFAVRQSKKAILEGLSLAIEDGLLAERHLFSECFAAPDQKEGMRAFLEKRPPRF